MKGPLTFQTVAMGSEEEPFLRVYFEGTLIGEDHARLYQIDSVDGDVGWDFHPGEATNCEAEEIVVGGDCEPEMAVGGEQHANMACPEGVCSQPFVGTLTLLNP